MAPKQKPTLFFSGGPKTGFWPKQFCGKVVLHTGCRVLIPIGLGHRSMVARIAAVLDFEGELDMDFCDCTGSWQSSSGLFLTIFVLLKDVTGVLSPMQTTSSSLTYHPSYGPVDDVFTYVLKPLLLLLSFGRWHRHPPRTRQHRDQRRRHQSCVLCTVVYRQGECVLKGELGSLRPTEQAPQRNIVRRFFCWISRAKRDGLGEKAAIWRCVIKRSMIATLNCFTVVKRSSKIQ